MGAIFYFKKAIKWVLPYGVVRVIQKMKNSASENTVMQISLDSMPSPTPMSLEYSCDCINCDSSEFLLLYPEYRIVRCSNCGLVYSKNRKTGEELERYYSSAYLESAKTVGYDTVGVPNEAIQMLIDEGNKDFFIEQSKRYLHTIESIILPLLGDAREGKHFIEVGCAWGACLLAAQAAGLQATGFEISTPNCQLGTKLSLDVRNEDFSQAMFPESSCSVVFFSHSFEHITTPNQYLRKAYEVCEKNGLLYLSVPNFDSYWHYSAGRSWDWLDPVAHVGQYTGETLCSMVRAAGFTVLKCYTTYSPEKILQFAMHEVDEKGEVLSKEAAERYLAVMNSLNKGENLIVIAQK